MAEQVGAIIGEGAEDWQVFQQDGRGFGGISVSGRWVSEAQGIVQLRLVAEDTGVALNPGLDWQPAETRADGTWTGRLEDVPAGGLYRLETRFNPAANTAGEWSPRGDMRFFLGVGDLWVIAGQSNSAGYGRGPVYDPPELGVHLFRNSERWALATHPMNESTDTRHPVNREAANSAHSPYLHFGRLLKQRLNHPIGLVQTSLGGSPLSAWDPSEPNPVLYENMRRCVALVGGRVRGVLWYQGESDAGDELSRTYEERFTRAVAGWREALANPDLAVITVQLNRVSAPPEEKADRGWTRVCEAQRQAARKVPGVAVVPTRDLSLSDGIHTSPAGNMLLGERMARAALGMAHGRPDAYRAPDLVEVRQEGQAVVLRFENVFSRLDTINPTAHSFRVEDEAGEVPVAQVVYPQDATIRLELGRALAGGARVHGGFGQNSGPVPLDMERFLPMLAFYGACVMCDGG